MTDDLKPWYAPGAVDEKALYVAARRESVLAFDVQPDGRIRNQRNFGRIAAGGNRRIHGRGRGNSHARESGVTTMFRSIGATAAC